MNVSEKKDCDKKFPILKKKDVIFWRFFVSEKKLAPSIIDRQILKILIFESANIQLMNKWRIFGDIHIWIILKM